MKRSLLAILYKLQEAIPVRHLIGNKGTFSSRLNQG